MWVFLLRAILQRLVLLVVISMIAFSIVHLAPGVNPSEVDPANPRMKPEDIARIRAAFHLDEPLSVQYVYWLRDLATGELKSFKDSQPVLPKNLAPVSQLPAALHLRHADCVEPVLSDRHSGRHPAWLSI